MNGYIHAQTRRPGDRRPKTPAILFAAAALLCASSSMIPPSRCLAQDGGPIQGATQAAPPDTAGTYLIAVWKAVRRKYPDALFISATASTDATGTPICSGRTPFQNGWRYTFYSPKAESYLMMAECSGSISGPLVQMRSKEKRDPKDFSVSGKFIDSNEAMQVLASAKISLEASAHGGVGKRPFLLNLHRLDDERFPARPAVWKVQIGKDSYLLDAVYGEVFSPLRYGVSLLGNSTGPVDLAVLINRPRKDKAKVYTVKKDYDRVLEYGKKYYPDSPLMAVEGFVDAWGASPCTGAGDGWAFYFYRPAKKDFKVVYACNGKIGPGPTQYIPVSPEEHEALDTVFVDSDKIIEMLLSSDGGCMNEGLGRNFTRNGVLLLRQHKKPPLAVAGLWDVRMLYQVTLGRIKYRFDARSGKLVHMGE